MTAGRVLDRRALLLAALLVIYAALGVYAEYWLAVIQPHPWADDFNIYTRALSAAQSGQSPYFPYVIGVSFVYHPFALTLVSLVGALGQLAASFVWAVLNVAGYGLALHLAMALLECSPPHRTVRSLIPILALFVAFAPFWEMLHIGQINGIVLACLILALYWSETQRPVLAGVALALAIVLKSSPLVLLLYFLVTRQWRVIAAALAAFALFSVLAWAQFGAHVMTGYAAVLSRLGAETHPDFYNHSATAIAMRIAAALGLDAPEASLATLHKLGTTLLIGVALGLGIVLRREDRRQRVWLYGLLLALMAVGSPLVWYHHNVFLMLPALALLVECGEDLDWRFWTSLILLLLLQTERLFEQVFPALPYEISGPSRFLAGRLAISGLPVLIAQAGLMAILAEMLMHRLVHPSQRNENSKELPHDSR